MNEIILEFNKIFKHEKVIEKNEYYKYTSNECLNYIKKSNKILFIVNCEYDAPKNECVINYYNQYWGNTQFNELLEKYKLRYEWYDMTTLFIYKDDDDDNND
jgi:hypothetical protein